MSKRKHGGSDRKSDKIGYLLRFLSEDQKKELEQLAADAGVSLNKFLVGLGEHALARKREQEANAALDAEREAARDAKWDEIVRCLGENAEDAKRKGRHDYLYHAVGGSNNGYEIEKIMKSGDRSAWPDANTGPGRYQITQEASRLLEYHRIHHYGGVLPRPRLLQLLEDYIKLEGAPGPARFDDDNDDDWVDEGDEFYQIDEFKWPGSGGSDGD
jgi:hypothetical protein